MTTTTRRHQQQKERWKSKRPTVILESRESSKSMSQQGTKRSSGKKSSMSTTSSSTISAGTKWVSKTATQVLESMSSLGTKLSARLDGTVPASETPFTSRSKGGKGEGSSPTSVAAAVTDHVIRARRNGAEVMLAEQNFASSLTMESSEFFKDSLNNKTICLKILRATGLAETTNAYCRVVIDGELVGDTPVRQPGSNPIFGGPSSTFRLEGTSSSKIVIEVLDNISQDKAPVGFIEINVSDGFPCTSRESSDRNPNTWIDIKPWPKCSALPSARLQVRLLSPESSPTVLQPLPSTKCLQAGPELSPRANSYVVRKLVMQSFAPVTLHVYDVSNNSNIADANYYIKAAGLGGVFHAAVEIHGREYSFGGSKQNVTGIFASPPKKCPMHHYRESVFLGDCELSPQQVQAVLNEMKPKWMARTYNLFRKNCCFFSREFAVELGVGTIPTWVYALAETAEPLEPYLNELARQQAENQQQKRQQQKDRFREENTGSPGETSDITVDHAMAARLQRSFRANRKAV